MYSLFTYRAIECSSGKTRSTLPVPSTPVHSFSIVDPLQTGPVCNWTHLISYDRGGRLGRPRAARQHWDVPGLPWDVPNFIKASMGGYIKGWFWRLYRHFLQKLACDEKELLMFTRRFLFEIPSRYILFCCCEVIDVMCDHGSLKGDGERRAAKLRSHACRALVQA